MTTNTENPGDSAHKTGGNPPDDEATAPATDDERTSTVEPHAGSSDVASKPSKPDALANRQWIHESGYGGKGGKPRVSSEQREASEHTVHTDEWPEFSADMLPSGTGPAPAAEPHTTEPHVIRKPRK